MTRSSPKTVIDHAFVVAAGKGTRMAPLTDTTPKPLCRLAGRPLLDYIFDHLHETDVTHVTVNSHHHAQQIADYVRSRTDFVMTESFEPDLLETGGGLKQALPTLGDKPFFMINGDAFWTNGPSGSILQQMVQQFDASTMDMLLLLIPVTHMHLTEGVGDYDLAANGRVVRNRSKGGTHMFTGIRILHPRLMANAPSGKYSFLQQMDESEAAGTLFAMVHDGDWHHISTPTDLATIDHVLRTEGSADAAQ